jgi:hypothetical protein
MSLFLQLSLVYVHVLCLCFDVVFTPVNTMTRSPHMFREEKSDDVWCMHKIVTYS